MSFDVDNSRLRKHFSITVDHTPLQDELEAISAEEIGMMFLLRADWC